MVAENDRFLEELAWADSKVVVDNSGKILAGENFEATTQKLDKLRLDYEALKAAMEEMKNQRDIELKANTEVIRNEVNTTYLE